MNFELIMSVTNCNSIHDISDQIKSDRLCVKIPSTLITHDAAHNYMFDPWSVHKAKESNQSAIQIIRASFHPQRHH